MKKHFLLLVALATLLAACHKTEEQKKPEIIVPENIAVVYISLNQFELVLQPGETAVIKATVGPDNATDKTVSWSSSDESVATVADGTVTAVQDGEAVITARAGDKEARCRVAVKSPEVPLPVPEMIDMGLSVKWASLNAGARTPEDYGGYYAWGETESKQIYTYDTYKYADMTRPDGFTMSLTKYNTIASWGPVDYRIILEEEDDVASVLYGEGWRTPTRTEMNELLANCTMAWTTQNGVGGVLVTSKINGNSLFFPAAGNHYEAESKFAGEQGMYWTSSLVSVEYPGQAAYLWFSKEESNPRMLNASDRIIGGSVRPVYGTPDVIHVEGVMIEPSVIEIEVGETVKLEAIVLPQNATDKSVTWTVQSHETRISVSSDGEVTGVKPTDWSAANVDVTTNDGLYTARFSIIVKDGSASMPIPEAVDLGLAHGIKWASFNVGASAPEEYGNYYAWGETKVKSDYSWETYQWYEGSTSQFAKYNSEGQKLEPGDDVATMKLGDGWRMPTNEEILELLTRCTSTWTTLNGVEGYEIKSGNGNSIFFPAAGYKVGDGTEFSGSIVLYWGSELFQPEHGGCIYLTSSTVYMGGSAGRYMGFPVRPVKD